MGALLCAGVTVVHVLDQGGLPGHEDPGYLQVGYYLLEVAGLLAALLLLSRAARAGWMLALGVAAGPMVGYVLSRGPGLPDAADDRGHWAEPLGLVSLAVEAALLVLALLALRRDLRQHRGR